MNMKDLVAYWHLEDHRRMLEEGSSSSRVEWDGWLFFGDCMMGTDGTTLQTSDDDNECAVKAGC